MSDAQKSVTHDEPEPYGAGLVSRKLQIKKAPILARPVGILTNLSFGRNLELIVPPSRVVRINDVHELACTTEACQPGDTVKDVGYLAFVTFEQSGVVVVGDILEVDGRDFGVVLGFNEIHFPNHINIVVLVEALTTGLKAGWRLDISLRFKRGVHKELCRVSADAVSPKEDKS